MYRIDGVEAIFGDCAFDVSSCAVIEENDNRGEYGSHHTVVHHQWQREENLYDCLREETDTVPADPWLDGLTA